jgi:membrane-bound metal-dependent hydrolase YbcI (DUF457 family)
MFVGHLAAAFGAKRVVPRAPLGALVTAAFGLDFLWPLFLLAGIEHVRIEPGNTAFTPLAFDHYPWSHSLAMAAVWSVLAGVLAARWLGHRPAGIAVGVTVASHWLLDFVTHRPDLPLWPGGPLWGLGLWQSIPATIVVEGLFLLGMIEVYRRAFRDQDATGRWALFGLITCTAAIWLAGPWAPPPPSVEAIAVAGFALWLIPLWAAWIERHRLGRDAGGAR